LDKLFFIKSPSGKNLRVGADSIYHAVQNAMAKEYYKYDRIEYFKLNQSQLDLHEAKIKRYRK
jgi:hypothetical protein